MYKCEKSPFGKFEKFTLTNGTGNQLVLLPGFGSCLLEVQLDGINVLDGYQEPQQVDLNRWYKNVLLYPFPNRMKAGQYLWKGKVYQFPINDPENDTAIHGFGVSKAMKVESMVCEEDRASISCMYEYTGKMAAFPFPFQFRASYEIRDPNQFLIRFSVTNTGSESMPFGFGWHPYFALSEAIAETALQLPTCQLIGVDGTMIPTGKRYEYDEFAVSKPIGATVLDNGFALRPSGKQAHILLKSTRGDLDFWMETGPNKYNYLQIFTPPYRGAIALEPMTCSIDAFNNGEGLMEIQPGEERSADFGFAFQKN